MELKFSKKVIFPGCATLVNMNLFVHYMAEKVDRIHTHHYGQQKQWT